MPFLMVSEMWGTWQIEGMWFADWRSFAFGSSWGALNTFQELLFTAFEISSSVCVELNKNLSVSRNKVSESH